MKRKLSLLLIIIMLLTIIPPQDVSAKIRISNTGAIVPIGMTKRLYVGGVSRKPTWTTSNKAVATVSSTGVVKGRKAGSCYITAKASGQTVRCYIKVINRYSAPQVGKVVLNRVKKYYPKATLLESSRSGSKIKLYICRPMGDGAPGREITVNIGTGKAVWESEWNDFFGKMPRRFNVWVCSAAKASGTKIVLNKKSASVVKGKSFTLKATVSPSKASAKGVKWSSSNSKVAKVTSKGVVKGVGYGTATITAKTKDGSGKKATCKVTVKKASSVPNVTDAVLKKKYADAAKYLKLNQRAKRYLSDYGYYEYYCIRKGRKLFDGSPRLQYLPGSNAQAGEWNLEIQDKSIAFQGVKVGMTVAKANSLLSKKWRKYATNYSNDEAVTQIVYRRNMNFSFTWSGYVSLFIEVNKGKVVSIGYYTIEGE